MLVSQVPFGFNPGYLVLKMSCFFEGFGLQVPEFDEQGGRQILIVSQFSAPWFEKPWIIPLTTVSIHVILNRTCMVRNIAVHWVPIKLEAIVHPLLTKQSLLASKIEEVKQELQCQVTPRNRSLQNTAARDSNTCSKELHGVQCRTPNYTSLGGGYGKPGCAESDHEAVYRGSVPGE